MPINVPNLYADTKFTCAHFYYFFKKMSKKNLVQFFSMKRSKKWRLLKNLFSLLFSILTILLLIKLSMLLSKKPLVLRLKNQFSKYPISLPFRSLSLPPRELVYSFGK